MLIHTAEVATVAYATDYRIGQGDGERNRDRKEM